MFKNIRGRGIYVETGLTWVKHRLRLRGLRGPPAERGQGAQGRRGAGGIPGHRLLDGGVRSGRRGCQVVPVGVGAGVGWLSKRCKVRSRLYQS